MILKNASVSVFLLACALSAPSVATAGSIIPTWIEYVEVDYSGFDPFTGQEIISVTSSSGPGFAGQSFTLYNDLDPRLPVGRINAVLVDYQNSGTGILNVNSARWLPGTPGPVKFDVYSFPASAQPPQISSPPLGSFVGEFAIPPGDHVVPPIPITLTSTGGGVCFLLVAQDDISRGGSEFTLSVPITYSSIPEPSSFLMLATAIAGVVLSARCRNTEQRTAKLLENQAHIGF
jgi:hypothetical protein